MAAPPSQCHDGAADLQGFCVRWAARDWLFCEHDLLPIASGFRAFGKLPYEFTRIHSPLKTGDMVGETFTVRLSMEDGQIKRPHEDLWVDRGPALLEGLLIQKA